MYLSFIFSFLLYLCSFVAPSSPFVRMEDAQPTFKGGQKALAGFIDNNLIYPEFSKDNCLQGIIQISFKLNKDGKIYDSKIQQGFGVDLDIEALRIVRLTSGKWIVPAGHDTLVALVLPVNFALRDFKCNQVSKDEINSAISAYRARVGLNNVIFNFYDRKIEGSYDRTDEARIIALKSQLGYDDKFIGRLLKQAQRKLKQGDNEGACEDAQTIRRLGSDLSATMIGQNCNGSE